MRNVNVNRSLASTTQTAQRLGGRARRAGTSRGIVPQVRAVVRSLRATRAPGNTSAVPCVVIHQVRGRPTAITRHRRRKAVVRTTGESAVIALPVWVVLSVSHLGRSQKHERKPGDGHEEGRELLQENFFIRISCEKGLVQGQQEVETPPNETVFWSVTKTDHGSLSSGQSVRSVRMRTRPCR